MMTEKFNVLHKILTLWEKIFLLFGKKFHIENLDSCVQARNGKDCWHCFFPHNFATKKFDIEEMSWIKESDYSFNRVNSYKGSKTMNLFFS